MADFYQSPTLITLSNICFNEQTTILNQFNQAIVVVIPCHYTHLEDKSIFHLLSELRTIVYISDIIVVINGGNHYCNDTIDAMKTIDKRCTALIMSLRDNSPGKGSALGFGLSYIYEKYNNQAIVATLDADVRNFTPALLLKLIYPMTELAADFNKGYYTRYSNNKLDGRLTRLLIFPLLQAFLLQEKNDPLLLFLLEFRYALSGEMAIKSELIPTIHVMPNWAYDLSLLVEVYKNNAGLNLFQTEITHNYQHPHRHLETTSDYNLLDVAGDIIRYLKSLYPTNKASIIENYIQFANHFITKYEALALFNGLFFKREQEEQLVHQMVSLLTQEHMNDKIDRVRLNA